MSGRRALVDTGAIYALVVRSDAHHEQARDFLRGWLARRGTLLLADVVFAETMTLLKARLGGAIAVRVGTELRGGSMAWTPLGPDGERDAWAAFRQYVDKEWSYTDCAILVLGERLGVRTVFGFDRHFEQMPGVRRVP